jgi:DNA-binding HxlR family transcriptional regulator
VTKKKRAVMRLLDVIGRRWTLRILWELREGPLNFRDLQDACDGLSPTTVNARLKDLRDLGIVELLDDGYAYTSTGEELMPMLVGVSKWANRHL